MTVARSPSDLEALLCLHEDPQRCASAAGLRYSSADEPGFTRRRCGRGFRYLDASGAPAAAAVRARIEALVIPPAWREVWVCPDENGHLLAIGTDDRGRRQYLYHPTWREFRDLVNFHRLGHVGRRLPLLRAHVDTQLRRRTLDRDRVLATMFRIIDACGLRIGNEEYAEENDSFGLCTLTKRHVQVRGGSVRFCFPAKSGKQADVELADPRVARVVRALLEQRSRRVFTVGGVPVDADEVNSALSTVCGPHVSAKDFRTWRGTTAAFGVLERCLRRRPDGAQVQSSQRERDVLAAVDAAAAALGNTRAVARGHYVHPQVLATYLSADLDAMLRRLRPSRTSGLDATERRLLPVLDELLAAQLDEHRGLR